MNLRTRSRSHGAILLAPLSMALLLSTCSSPPDEGLAEVRAMGTEVLTQDGESLGRVNFPTSCDPAVQTDLEVGLGLLHHMNYSNAKPAFEAATLVDPECAIAHWGVAMTYVHPLWPDLISTEALAAGGARLAAAKAASRTSEREAGYVAALAAFYEGDERSEQARLAAFQDGWAEVHQAFPEDLEAAAFYSLALLGTAAPEDKSYTNQHQAAAILKDLLKKMPKHPGAHHYAIHAHDFPPLAADGLDIARRYDDLAPENTHALHMTSHIFTRLGLWEESIEFNVRAAIASTERTPAGTVSLHHFHALDYLAYAHLQQADDRAAEQVLAAVNELQAPFQNHPATAYAFAAIPVRIALERHQWEAAAAIEPRQPEEIMWVQYPYLEAISEFAVALGAARSGQPKAARAAIARLEGLETAAAALNSAYDWGVQVAIQKTAAQAWLAYESGEPDQGLELARRAAEMEGSTEKNPVTPGEVLPAGELYGDMLLAAGRPAEALAAYEEMLVRSPNRYNSLFGAGQAAEALGDMDVARGFYKSLLEICPDPSGVHPALEAALTFVEGGGAPTSG